MKLDEKDGMAGFGLDHGQVLRCVLVIPAHNEQETLIQCLDALAIAVLPGGVEWGEWILLDGCSTDKTVERWLAWEELHPELSLRVLRSPERIGKAAELEQVRKLLADYDDPGLLMAVCDADSRVDPLAFGHLLQPFVDDEQMAVTWGVSRPLGPKQRRRASWFQACLTLALAQRLGESAVRAEGRLFAIRPTLLDGFAWLSGLISDDTQLAQYVTSSGVRHRSVLQAQAYIVPARGWLDFYHQTYRFYHAEARLDTSNVSAECISNLTTARNLERKRQDRWLRLGVFVRESRSDPVGAIAYVVGRFVCVMLERFAPAEFADDWPEARSTKVGINSVQVPGTPLDGRSKPSRSRMRALSRVADRVILAVRVVLVCRNWPKVLVAWWANRVPLLEVVIPKDLELRLRTGGIVRAPNTALGGWPVIEVLIGDAYHLDRLPWKSPSELSLSVLDIGAHVGSFSVAFALRYPLAIISAYEPSPHGAAYLKSNIAANGLDDRVKGYEAAIASEPGSVRLYSNGDASCEASVIRSSDLDRELEPSIAIECVAVAFEAAMRSAGKVDLVKMDCEGAEYDIILRSSPASWGSVSCVLLEYHPVSGHSWDELRRYFEDLGFAVSWLEADGTRAELGMAMLTRVARVVLA